MELSKYITTIPNYPEDGVEFKDITPLLINRDAFRFALSEFEKHFIDDDVQYIAGIEAHGFADRARRDTHQARPWFHGASTARQPKAFRKA
mgnify:CR=1 FL=1